MGAQPENVLMVDRVGVIHHERRDLNEYKQAFAINTAKRSLEDAMIDADVFIGLSGPDVMTPDMLKSMAKKPVIFALSNPVPEIMPTVAHQLRNDLIIATGRSDFPNQVNNALCFPYIFRGALDVRASCINETMKLAAVHALKELAREVVPEEMLIAYKHKHLEFGANYILPMLLDKRLKSHVAEAVAKAAIVSGVAQVELTTINHD
jgi:malate dehydrogenase (oxaloacetate-decarboxylating)(NADP+)